MNMKNRKAFHFNKRIGFLLLSLIILLIVFFILFVSTCEKSAISSAVLPHELIDHPIYSLYEFNQNDSLINIGIQPEYLPTGIIFEVIKRDNILGRTLSAFGKQIKYYSFLKGADVNYFLQQNKLSGGVGGDMPALSAASSFEVIIPVIIQKGNASIVSTGPMLIEDLKGKRIAYPYGSVSHYFILELLHSAGITEEMVRLIPMDLASMAKSLHNHEVDLFSAWEPTVTSTLKQYPEAFITYQKITTGYLYFLKAFFQMNPEIVKHILAAVIRSISWIKSDRENLLLACEWNIKAMEELSGEKSVLNAEEIANLALQDIIGDYSKYSIVLSTEDIETDSPLHNEYKFLKTLFDEKDSSNWEQVSGSFTYNMLNEIIKLPEEFHLNDYDYVLTEQ